MPSNSRYLNELFQRYERWRIGIKFVKLAEPDTMDDQEKQTIRVGQCKKYGAISSRGPKVHETLIRHEIEKSDTLQGISLKYGCTTEQIRRANRLFASDSLFLRQFLLIPVDKDSPYYPKDDRPHSLPPQRAASIAGYPSSSDAHRSTSMDQLSPQISPEEENRKHLEDFLSKIDSSISNSKKFVKQQKDVVSSSQSDNEIFAHGSTSGDYLNPTTSYQQYGHHGPSNNNYHHNNNGGEAYQMSVISKGKHVKTSLQRLEQQQDEFFEL